MNLTVITLTWWFVDGGSTSKWPSGFLSQQMTTVPPLQVPPWKHGLKIDYSFGHALFAAFVKRWEFFWLKRNTWTKTTFRVYLPVVRWKVESTFEVVKIPNLFCAKFTRTLLNLCHKNGWIISQSRGILWRERNENKMKKFSPKIFKIPNLFCAKFTCTLLILCRKSICSCCQNKEVSL